MDWKEILIRFERNKQWDYAIEFMQDIITQHPDDLDAYLNMNYLLMNLLVEERYDINKYDYYAALLKKYFDESYAKFSQNPEYLFFIGRIGSMSEWYYGVEIEEVEAMLNKAIYLEPNNTLYQWTYFMYLDENDQENKKFINSYAKSVINNDSIKQFLLSKGSLGEYILGILTKWARDIIEGKPS